MPELVNNLNVTKHMAKNKNKQIDTHFQIIEGVYMNGVITEPGKARGFFRELKIIILN